MWFIFVVACIVTALIAIFVVFVGHKVLSKIERDDKMAEIESEAYKKIKESIRNNHDSWEENKE